MAEKRFIKVDFVYVPILCVIGLLISYWAGKCLFSPGSWIVEDANSISANVRDRFSFWLDARPAHVTHVYEYEYDTKGLFSNAFLRFAVIEPAEYMVYKSRITQDRRLESASAFPRMARGHLDRIASWWVPPNRTMGRFGDHYFAFDDPNRVVYMMYVCPD